MNHLDFTHHIFINMQTTRGINDEYILKLLLCSVQGIACDFSNRLPRLTGIEINIDLTCHGFKLLNRSGPVDIAGNHHDGLAFLLLQEASKFTDRRGFTRTLQTCHKNDRRRLARQVQ